MDKEIIKEFTKDFKEISNMILSNDNNRYLISIRENDERLMSKLLNIVFDKIVKFNLKTALFSKVDSFEFSKNILCLFSNVSLDKANNGELTEAEWDRIWSAQERIESADIMIDCNTKNTIKQICVKCKKVQNDTDLAIIYYKNIAKCIKNPEKDRCKVLEMYKKINDLTRGINKPIFVFC